MVIYRTENEKTMADYLGVAYLKVPRIILEQLVNENSLVRKQGLLHLVLFASCSYVDKTVTMDRRQVNCLVGDYVGTQAELAQRTGFHVTVVGRILRGMESRGLISVTRLRCGCKIHLYGYAAFTAAQEAIATKAAAREAAGKDPASLAAELEEAKKRVGGRRMDDETPKC